MRALFSYEAPEFNESGSYTDRSDVYSFVVVMLELLTGRKPYDRWHKFLNLYVRLVGRLFHIYIFFLKHMQLTSSSRAASGEMG